MGQLIAEALEEAAEPVAMEGKVEPNGRLETWQHLVLLVMQDPKVQMAQLGIKI